MNVQSSQAHTDALRQFHELAQNAKKRNPAIAATRTRTASQPERTPSGHVQSRAAYRRTSEAGKEAAGTTGASSAHTTLKTKGVHFDAYA
jgi:hypothetical protein